MQFWVN